MHVDPDELEAAFARGVALARAGRYFEAHEELETAWRAAAASERDFFQGLVHVVVAWYQAGRGNRVGCERQLAKADRRLRPYAPVYRGIDVRRVLDQVAAADVTRMGSLDLAQAERVEHPAEADVQPPLAVEEEEEPERHE